MDFVEALFIIFIGAVFCYGVYKACTISAKGNIGKDDNIINDEIKNAPQSRTKVTIEVEYSVPPTNVVNDSKRNRKQSHGRVGYLEYKLSDDDILFCENFKRKIADKIKHKKLLDHEVITHLPMHMISLHNRAITPMIYYPHFDNLKFLDEKELPYIYLLMYQAGRPDNDDYYRYWNGVSIALFPDPDKAIHILWKLGFLQECTVEFMLTVASSNDLAALLKNVGLKCPPKKIDRFNLALKQVGEDVLKAHLNNNRVFAPSPLGYCMIQSLFYHTDESLFAIDKLKRENKVSSWSLDDILCHLT